MRNEKWARSQQVLHYTHLQTWQCHSHRFRRRWDDSPMAVLRGFQHGNAFHPPVSTMKLFRLMEKSCVPSCRHLLRSCPETHLTEAHKQSNKGPIRRSCVFSGWTIHRIDSQRAGRHFVSRPRFPEENREAHSPWSCSPKHKHVPRGRTHGANRWKIVHSLDLVTSCIHPKNTTHGPWLMGVNAGPTKCERASAYEHVTQNIHIHHVWPFGLERGVLSSVFTRTGRVMWRVFAANRRYICT